MVYATVTHQTQMKLVVKNARMNNTTHGMPKITVSFSLDAI